VHILIGLLIIVYIVKLMNDMRKCFAAFLFWRNHSLVVVRS